MVDHNTTVEALKEQVKKFVEDRDWSQFHTPKNLSMNIAVEAAELMEHFLWVDSAGSADALEAKRQDVEDELADVFLGVLAFCVQNDIDLSKALEHKLALAKEKYPVEKAKGNYKKYTEF